ncbi:hypothetical protein COO60DRAFT_617187 [Scenedesmus sp. NREL 46B-D3]|nr:hypothetical protein COO60DRAFT_617187 [Scenedesmus sp. NREL 46B-D3]
MWAVVAAVLAPSIAPDGSITAAFPVSSWSAGQLLADLVGECDGPQYASSHSSNFYAAPGICRWYGVKACFTSSWLLHSTRLSTAEQQGCVPLVQGKDDRALSRDKPDSRFSRQNSLLRAPTAL